VTGFQIVSLVASGLNRLFALLVAFLIPDTQEYVSLSPEFSLYTTYSDL